MSIVCMCGIVNNLTCNTDKRYFDGVVHNVKYCCRLKDLTEHKIKLMNEG